MPNYSLTHLGDADLVRQLAALVNRDRATTAMLLAHIAEVDDRGLYRPPGYPSMHAYCMGELRFSEDAAYKRIRAARAGRKFPVLFTALADGRFHLAALYLLAPHFTLENVDELIEAATHRSKSDIEELIARRFGVPGSPISLRPLIRAVAPIPPPTPSAQLMTASGNDDSPAGESLTGDTQLAMAPEPSHQKNYGQLAPGPVGGTQVQSLSQNCPVFLVRLTVPKSTCDKLHYAQSLLNHAVPAGDLAQVFDRALDALISQLEVRKLGASTRDLRGREEHAPASGVGRASRYIPAAVRRAVWERDQGRCTFVSITGGRCRSRRFLEMDHVVPAARGGKATVQNLRLRCSAHNQYEAERAFGVDFIRRKRQEAFATATARDLSKAPAAPSAAEENREDPA
jgi:5-methylcytosine-specific restriction endonuclease McrA